MNGHPLLLVAVCLGYLAIIVVTNRGLIAAPRCRLQHVEVMDCRDRADVMFAQVTGDPVAQVAYRSIRESLCDIDSRCGIQPHDAEHTRWLPRVFGWLFNAPLTKLAADLQRLNAVRRRLVQLVPDEDLMAYAQPIIASLVLGKDAERRLREQLTDAPTPNAKRIIIENAHELLDVREDASLTAEFEHQRISLWLAIVGLDGIMAVGMVFGHETTMLLGALGGFLAPVVSSLNGKKVESSWGVMVLSPVGGALAAAGGLLLVRFLSDPKLNLLGGFFRENSWEQASTPIALALALLFGFSGRLFSSMAISATAQLSVAKKSGEAV